MRNHLLLLTAAIAATATLGLSGCTNSTTTTDPTPSRSTNITATAAPQLPGQTPGVTGATDVPTKLDNVASKRSAVSITTCRAAKGGWEASGKAINRSKHLADYTITVFFTDANGTVAGWRQIKAEAEPGKSAQWSASAKFTPPSDTACVLAAVS